MVYVEVDLSRNLKESMEIQIGATTFTQKVLYPKSLEYLLLLSICLP